MKPAAALLTSPLLCLVLWVVLIKPALAGHGLINSFAGIEWLPEPDGTPHGLTWRFERWRETRAVASLRNAEARIDARLALARERIAEALAEVRAERADAARPAVDDYGALVTAAADEVGTLGEASHTRALALAGTLLEHRYIVSTEYLDLPRNARRSLAPLMELAAAQYARLRQGFSRREQESLFFREEETRWSWEQAQAADAQGL
jgi:hypothetical protein